MLHANTQSNDHQLELLIQPNRNLSWNETRLVFLFLALCIAAVAVYFVTLGAWLVLPFAGLEVLVIGAGLYYQSCRAHRQQVIRVDADSISISNGKQGGQPVCFSRAWSKLVYTRDPSGWYPGRLFIGSHGKFIEIGKCLIESERETLADNLRRTIEGA